MSAATLARAKANLRKPARDFVTADEALAIISIGQLVRAREELGMTQSQLGKLVGLPQSYISRVERDPTRSSVALIMAIAQALGLRVLLDPTRSPRPSKARKTG